jgi:SAM-dependent methyltransferase
MPALASSRTETCPLCGGATAHAFTTRDRNRAISDEPFSYRRCADCGALYLANVPDDLARFYPTEYFVLPALDELRERAVAERWRMALVAPHVAGGRLIEIGPGDGLFAIQALDAGFDVAAIEADPAAAAHLRDVLGIEVARSSAPEDELAALGPAQAVVAWHVLEHVPRPWAVVDAAAAALTAGGVLVIATPNPRAFGLRVLGPRWPHVDAPRHLFLLPHDAVIARCRARGLEPVALTATDPGGLGWNAFAWHYTLRRPGARWARERAAEIAGDVIARALAPVERHGLRGAAYTLVLRKASDS